jgi:hypothetical protein
MKITGTLKRWDIMYGDVSHRNKMYGEITYRVVMGRMLGAEYLRV